VIPIGAAPETFNPVLATDSASQLVASLTNADLMHIDPRTLAVKPALALAVDHLTPLRWIVHLRPGVRFSDGAPFTAADVVFSFAVYTDPRLDAPERALLTAGGKPIVARALDPATVELDLPAPFAVGDRLFDSVWMLPRHLLYAAWRAGRLAHTWLAGAHPAAMAGLGPFRLAQVRPGALITLARNRYFWQRDASGARLPYLRRIRLRVVADPNLRLTLFVRGEVDGISTLASADYARLRGNACCRVLDAGAGLSVEALVLNQKRGPSWFRHAAFRQAVSLAIDRANLARNVYAGYAQPLASLTSPSDRRWADPTPASAVDLPAARARLRGLGFRERGGKLYDAGGRAVAFSLLVPASNAERMHMAVFLQQDLARLGMQVAIVPLDFSNYVNRLLDRDDFEAALVGIQIPDADPNEEGTEWRLNGALHLWDEHPAAPPAWERRLDALFRDQVATPEAAARLAAYRQIQAIEHRELPLIALVAPDVLAAANPRLAGAAAALLPPHLLWNAARLRWRGTR
jgi:peptide/nickel transport system substrate-binding protein